MHVKTKRSSAGLSSKQLRCIVDDDRPSVGGAYDGLQNLLLRIVKCRSACDGEFAELSAYLMVGKPGSRRHSWYENRFQYFTKGEHILECRSEERRVGKE